MAPRPLGFPWAEIAADGSSVIGKHDGTGGSVSPSARSPRSSSTRSAARTTSAPTSRRASTPSSSSRSLATACASHGIQGEPPPATLKVCDERARRLPQRHSTWPRPGSTSRRRPPSWRKPSGRPPVVPTTSRRSRAGSSTRQGGPGDQRGSAAIWRITVKDPDESKVGRALRTPGAYGARQHPGLFRRERRARRRAPFGVYRPATVPRELVPQYVPSTARRLDRLGCSDRRSDSRDRRRTGAGSRRRTRRRPARRVPRRPLRRQGRRRQPRCLCPWRCRLGVARPRPDRRPLRELLPETADMTIERYRYPQSPRAQLRDPWPAEEGVAASTRQDAQAKAVGEWLRARVVSVPQAVLH